VRFPLSPSFHPLPLTSPSFLCSDSITSEERSLAFWLAEHGDYQVYLGNARGVFDMGHSWLKRSDPRFWGASMLSLFLTLSTLVLPSVRMELIPPPSFPRLQHQGACPVRPSGARRPRSPRYRLRQGQYGATFTPPSSPSKLTRAPIVFSHRSLSSATRKETPPCSVLSVHLSLPHIFSQC
jgi:hypothetical protein